MQFQIENNVLVRYDYDHQEESVVIPGGVEVIGSSAFSYCRKISEILIPDSVKEIRSGAFKESGIVSVTIPDSVTELGQDAFAMCEYLEKAELGEGIVRIDAYTFRRCHSLEYLRLPSGLQEAGYDAFEECYCLKKAWVDGTEYRLRDRNAPRPVALVLESISASRRRYIQYAESGAMDEFEYTDYCIAGDGYSY